MGHLIDRHRARLPAKTNVKRFLNGVGLYTATIGNIFDKSKSMRTGRGGRFRREDEPTTIFMAHGRDPADRDAVGGGKHPYGRR
jgi:hypothetical protein